MIAQDIADFGALLRVAARMLPDAAAWDWFFGALPPPVLRRIREEFFAWQAHGGQQEPGGDWRTWLIMAGRGFGKTLAGAEWVSERARAHPGARIALVGASIGEVARVMIEGPSGLLAVARTGESLRWVPTRRTLHFPSGAEAFAYSGAAPDALRGPQHHFAWCDEIAKWRRPDEAWDNLQLGMRLGARPRLVVTTTPRAGRILRRIRGLDGTVETHGRTDDNVHAAEAFRDWVRATYGGTRLGRQELDGVLLDEADGALMPRAILEAARGSVPGERDMRRIVVGVDPPASADGTCGIVVCGTDAGGTAWVLADRSVAGLRPDGWARAVAKAAELWGADRVIAEKNQGGDMVESVLRSAASALPVRLVSASRGKAARAEPIAALLENGGVKLAGRFPALEDELAGLTLGGGYEGPGKSPDRADACVWALTELTRPARVPRMRVL